jgi:hypothetical protein
VGLPLLALATSSPILDLLDAFYRSGALALPREHA